MKINGLDFKNCLSFSLDAMHDFERAVGWELPGQPLPTGEVPAEVVARIKQFVDRSVACETALGFSRIMSSMKFIIAVPMDGVLYIAPTDIYWLVTDRRYSPPQEFLDAVMKAPLPDTPEYEAAVSPFRQSYREERRRLELSVQEQINKRARPRSG